MIDPEDKISWQCPAFTAPAQDRMGWIETMIEEGEGFLSGQSFYRDLNKNLRIFDAIFNDNTKSTLVSNELKYDIRKIIETLAEVKEIALYGSDYQPFKPLAQTLNNVALIIT